VGEKGMAVVVQQKESKDGVTRPYIKTIDFPIKFLLFSN
jgi:hypothetical protein